MWVLRGIQKNSLDCRSWLLLHKMPFYAVAKGRSVGIYESWAECEAQVKGFSGARYKKFDSASSAHDFVSTEGGPSNASKPRQHYNYETTSAGSSNYTLKRPYPSLVSNNHHNGNSNRAYSSSTSHVSAERNESDDDLSTVLCKQMDDIEKRLKSFSRGIDKIEKGASRKAVMIEPPEPKRARRNHKGFEEDSEGYVQVYTDGACSSNGRSGARAGIGVFWGSDHDLNVSEPVSGRATNNCGEIQAATRAMKQALDNGVKNITINTDSKFLIDSVTKWMPGWKRKGWKLKSGEEVKNEKDFKDLDSVQHKLNVKWNYVQAHKGVHGNDMADQLAKAGATQYRE